MESQQTIKAVILARGLGTRMRKEDGTDGLDDQQEAVAQTGVKALIPIDRPFLDYVLSALADAGFKRVCLIVGPDHEAIRTYYTQEVKPERISVEFAVQQEPKGTADAVLAAEQFAAGDSFIVLNSDDYYPVEALRALHEANGSGVALFEMESMLEGSNIAEDRLKSFAVGEMNGSGMLARVIEKPDEETLSALPRPLWISMNCWRFSPAIFDACRAIPLSARGELELPDAVQHAINVQGEEFPVAAVKAPVLDITSRRDIAPVAKRLADVEVQL